jgi:hypothetical protein
MIATIGLKFYGSSENWFSGFSVILIEWGFNEVLSGKKKIFNLYRLQTCI